MPLPEFSGTLGLKRAAHLLRRATFGATKQQIDSYAALTPAQAITQLFRQALPNPVLPIDPKTGQTWVTITGDLTDANSEDGDLQEFFKGWFIGQMMNPSLAYSAREKMVMFLHTHFTTLQEKVNNSRALYFQNQLFRIFALDALNASPDVNIKELSVRISIDNAMLTLLDGTLNVKGSPNENYGRELLELYTIGRGLEGNVVGTPEGDGDYIVYKEEDVQAAAKVLSGWETDDDFATVYLAPDPAAGIPHGRVKGGEMNASSHDNDPKTFSNRLDSAIIQANPPVTIPTYESALNEIRQLIDLIYSKEETRKNICRKIYRFFVYGPHTTDHAKTIDDTIITEMANTLLASNYKIQLVIENLLRSQHFYEAGGTIPDDNFGGIIKSPLDLTLGTLRFFNVQLPDMTTQPGPFYEATGTIISQLDIQGMKFYQPYDVAGYDAYHQFPLYHRFWITPNSITRRYDFIRDLFTTGREYYFKIDSLAYVSSNFGAVAPSAPNLIIELVKYLFPISDSIDFSDATNSGLTTARMNYFRLKLLNGFDEAYYTAHWNDDAGWMEYLFNTLLQSPEYQLA
jgi:uncharacterized protein (DUF1800 family)